MPNTHLFWSNMVIIDYSNIHIIKCSKLLLISVEDRNFQGKENIKNENTVNFSK